MEKELKDSLKEGISELLPSRDEGDNYSSSEQRSAALEDTVEAEEGRISAATLARMKSRERRDLERAKKASTEAAEEKREQLQRNIAEIEAVEQSPEAQGFLSGGFSDLSPYAGTTKKEVARLLSSLNINLSMSLSQQDTYNLLGCLLTCNESQLEALYDNPRIPLAIKTVIRRIMDDSQLGNMETIERLWDRVFGKAGSVTLSMPAVQQESAIPGIIPGQVVSREAMVLIKESIYGK